MILKIYKKQSVAPFPLIQVNYKSLLDRQTLFEILHFGST